MNALAPEADWVARLADEVIAESRRRAPGKPVVCASGLSPSGPIHLGNLREVMIPHLVADEIRRRGIEADHLISWDDYDRFRKVPAGIDPSWSQHIGKPLSAVPAPPGSTHASWADHFRAELVDALVELGIEFRGISQTAQYTSGAYREQILFAMRERAHIDAVLARYRTLPGQPTGRGSAPRKAQKLDEQEAAAAAEAVEGSGAASEDDGSVSASGYYPYKPYCTVCGTDFTTVTAYDDDTTALTYDCRCGHSETVLLSEFNGGKLVWKVDWPMRWTYEGVIFEPSGVDHQSPGSSWVVGGQLVKEVFGGTQPIGPMYAFVGIKGMAKMSSSRGGVPTPADALEIMEPALVRWLYARRKPAQSFNVAFDGEVHRMYDEWDSLSRKVADDTAQAADLAAHARATSTATGTLPTTPRPLPYRTLASVVDITTGDDEQTLRILSDLDPERPVSSLDELRPRLTCAQRWVETQMPEQERTHVRTEPDLELLDALDDRARESLRLLAEGLRERWSLDGLTALVYAVPKIQAGLPPEAKAGTPELKAAQRQFFVLLYRLLIGKDTGPRLPTLLLAVGEERLLHLIGAA
jgi:lysyl-tRNA synthetase, class I